MVHLQTEVRLRGSPGEPFDSLYIGGGTPTVLPGGMLEEMICRLLATVPLAAAAEITVEANPDDVTSGLLRGLRRAGVNRLSIGVQSFHDDELRFLGRRHTAHQARAAIGMARAAGFANLGIDLMFGFRGQRRDRWLRSLDEMWAWRPEHVSCYQLSIEADTPLGRRVACGSLARVPESKEHSFFLATSQLLRARGYQHYEVSNFALPGFRSRHNLRYWRRAPYLGLGPSAHSFDGTMRWWNVRSVTEYAAALGRGLLPVAESERLTDEQVYLEQLMLGFRTDAGVEIPLLSGHPLGAETLERLEAQGLLVRRDGRAVPTLCGLALGDRLPLEFVS
jgi:oxygen-independent coproporphyrinogen-3 oxidase